MIVEVNYVTTVKSTR